MYESLIVAWIIGLFVSLGVGHLVASILLVRLRMHFEGRKKEWIDFPTKIKERFYLGIDVYPPIDARKKGKLVHPAIIGTVERLFITIITAYDLTGGVITMFGWIALKMIVSRPYSQGRAKELRNEKGFAKAAALGFDYAGLIGNLTSMFFALIGGLLIRLL